MINILPVELFYEEQGTGLPVILLHGFPYNHTVWQPVASRMACDARLILPDLRGHGQSPVTEGVYTMRIMVEDIINLMDRLSLEKVVLVGHSMGGYIALDFARAYPSRLAGLGLVASHAAADSPERKMARYKTAREILKHGVHRYADGNAARVTFNPDLAPVLHAIMMTTPPLGAAGAMKGMAERLDSMELLPQINVPAVVVLGESDLFIPPEVPETMEQLLPKGWLVKIPATGHVPMMEKPDEVSEALCDLLRAVKSQ